MLSSVFIYCCFLIAACVGSAKSGDWCKFGDAIDITGIRINREFIAPPVVPIGAAFTIEAWVWHAEPESKEWSTIASRAPSFWQWPTLVPNVYADFNFQIDDYGLLSFFMGNGEPAPWQYGILLLSPEPIRRRTWTHVAVTVDAPGEDGNPSAAHIYIDGELVDSDIWGDGERQLLDAERYPLRIGLYDNTDFDKQWWNGFLDEVRFWEQPRSGADIAADMYLALNDENKQGLLAYYQFDTPVQPNNASIIVDSSGNDRTATVQFDGPIGPVYFVENRVCSDDHLRRQTRADRKRRKRDDTLEPSRSKVEGVKVTKKGRGFARLSV